MTAATQSALDYPFVFRFNTPPGRKGQRCRFLKNRIIKGRLHGGEQLVTVQFADGALEAVCRSAIVPADSKAGRQTAARVARGEVRNRKRGE